MAVGALNYVILTANGEHNTVITTLTCNEAVPTTGYPFMLVVASPFEIIQADSQASTYVMNVTRGQEGTSGVTIPTATQIVCELTHEALDDVYGELLVAQKVICGNETNASMIARTPDVNEITIDNTNDIVYIGVDGTPNTWEKLCPELHANLTLLTSSTGHTMYFTAAASGTGDDWHDALADEHLATLDHDHLTQPAANMRDLATEPADTTTGGVYYNTTNYSIYYYDGASWKQYSTVPTDAIIFRDDGSCPTGWTEKTSWNGYYLKGETVATWTGGTGGSATHVHGVSTIPQHAHSMPDRSVTVDAVANHTHVISCGTTTSGSQPLKTSDNSTGSNLQTTGAHTHTLTVPEHDTASAGTSSAESQSKTSEPKYVELTICEKN